jgi:serine/threonine-protein kinase
MPKIGRFDVISEISKSASGGVYKANDPGASRTVALKVLRLDLPAQKAAILEKLILKEAESTKVLNSPNIGLVYGVGEVDGQFCAAMEYVEGNSLSSMIARQEGFSIWDLLDIGRQVCLALDHANSRGVLHRSLEPEKIMMQWDGTVKVLGYGISTMVSAIPSEGKVPPLFYYMSPEQVKGEAMDIRSNIFTWGAILYEMVTDRKPFTGSDVQTVRQQILEETPEPPAMINPRIHLGVSRVIMQALSKSPEERYQHAHELMMDLERAKDATQGKPAPSAQPAQGVVAPQKLNRASSAPSSEPASAAKKAAAAVAAAGQATAHSTPAGRMSASPAAPPADPPKFKIDPAMAEGGSATRKPVSFSDLEEMPPMKEAYVAPQPPAADLEEAAPTPPTVALRPRTVKEYKPSVVTRENARKAVKEIRGMPPKLAMYAICGAAAVVLFAIVGMWLHFRGQVGDSDEGLSAAAQTTVEQPVSEPASTDTAGASESATAEPEVTVTPRFPAAKKRPRVAPRVQPTPMFGQLTVTSTPEGAQVQVDGRTDPGWITPYVMNNVSLGQHTVTVAKPGFNSETRTVDVASAKSMLALRLTQLGATLAVTSDPAGASVYLDGKSAGHTPIQIVVPEKGSHTILVRKDGYLDETTSANLVAGQTFRYAPHMRALGVTDDIKVVGKFNKLFGKRTPDGMTKISVKTQPKGAQVTANRRMVDKPTPVDFMLNPGNYVIEITKPGYKPVKRVINLEEGVKIEVNENLEPE